MHILVDSPVLYGLNPKHPEISSQGLRDDEVSIPKPEGTTRVLVLGDSVAYGKAVAKDKTFPNLAESALQDILGPIEVINSGVSGYTTYNELQYYLTQGRQFDADVVLLALCMNDVVNPRLHWGHRVEKKIANIPSAAIPNLQDDEQRIKPLIDRRKGVSYFDLLDYSRLYRSLLPRAEKVIAKATKIWRAEELPTYITGEDSLSIEVLLNPSSAEWRWLTATLTELKEAVAADGAKLSLIILPLAYQLDKDYPYLPQANIMQYCDDQGIDCIDLLPEFRNYPKEDLFPLHSAAGYYDIWHLTQLGHEVAADAVSRYLLENRRRDDGVDLSAVETHPQ